MKTACAICSKCLYLLNTCTAMCRERERKLVAVQTAQQSSVEELERKIQIKHTEYAKRYDMQLEQIREKAALTSKHVSEDSLRVTPFEKRQWCKLCQVKVGLYSI